MKSEARPNNHRIGPIARGPSFHRTISNLKFFSVALATSCFVACNSKVKLGEYPLKEIQEDTCSGYKAVSMKFRNTSLQGVFLVKDTADVIWDDLLFQVYGSVRTIKWTGCRNLEITSEGRFKDFDEERYLENGGDKYPGLQVDLIHHQL